MEIRWPDQETSTIHAAPGGPSPHCGEVRVDSGVELNLQLEVKLVQELFLVREIRTERARGNSRASGDLRGSRAESGLGDLEYCRLEDCVAFLRAPDSCQA